MQVFGVAARTPGEIYWGKNPDDYGYINQHGLSRKVCSIALHLNIALITSSGGFPPFF